MMMIIAGKLVLAALLLQLKLISAAGLLFAAITTVESNKILQTKPYFINEENRYSTL